MTAVLTNASCILYMSTSLLIDGLCLGFRRIVIDVFARGVITYIHVYQELKKDMILLERYLNHSLQNVAF